MFPVGGCVTSRPSCRRRQRHRRFPLCGRGLGRMAGGGRDPGEDALSAFAELRLRCRAEQFLPIRRHAPPSMNTQDGYARDLKAFLNFLWHNRKRSCWQDATTADHMAYLVWRRKDPAGPRVDDATSDREVTAVNRFYSWQVSANSLPDNPIPQRPRRPPPPTSGRGGRGEAATTPATHSHAAGREKIEWLPPATYPRRSPLLCSQRLAVSRPRWATVLSSRIGPFRSTGSPVTPPPRCGSRRTPFGVTVQRAAEPRRGA